MKKVSFIAYMVSIGMILLMLLYMQFGMNISEQREKWDSSCETVKNYQISRMEDDYAPQGITYEYKWVLKDIPANGACVTFYSVHNYVEMYLRDTKIYDLEPKASNVFGKTSGCLWPMAVVSSMDAGQEITLRVSPVYSPEAGDDITIYMGTEYGIFLHILKENLGIAILGVLAVIIGVCLIILNFAYKHTGEQDNGILMLGIFSIETGIWKLTDMSAATYIFKNPLVASMLALITLSAMPTAFILFVRHQFSSAKKPVWDYMAISGSVVSTVLVLLQWNNIADFRESLWVTHVMIIVLMSMIVVLMVLEQKQFQYNERLVVTIMCTFLCIFGMAIDMFVYYKYNSNGNMIFGVAALLIYIIIMGCYTILDARKLMDIGLEARKYENLAYHDKLTGLYNRMFYEDYVQNIDLDKGNCFFIVFDVNNLKTCNDTRGHDHGDVLIKSAAAIIDKVFGDNGICCRIGGDEFYVVLQGISLMQLEEWLKDFEILTTKHNLDHPEQFEIKVAYGFARYDYRIDYDFAATVRRADKMMYEKKTEMKRKA